MRIFIGIDLDDEIRGKIGRLLEGISNFAPDARWVRPESLHVTLKFIGEQPSDRVEAIKQRLSRVRSAPFQIRFAGYGFFPTAKAPRVFWIGIQTGPQLGELATQVDSAVAELGIPREDRAFSPHLTLARGGGRSGDPKWHKGDAPNATFSVLQKRLATMGGLNFSTERDDKFGTMTADKFFLYQSRLSPGGSQYTKVECFPMGPAQTA